jgi:type II secretory pathway pseudopilin PulG
MRAGSLLRQRGFTYLWLLAAVAVIGIAMSTVGPLWAQQRQREREAELTRIGMIYVNALEDYYRMSSGSTPHFPAAPEELLLDLRFNANIRHLRQFYDDPVAPGQPLVWIRNERNELVGVRSASIDKPLRQVTWTDGRHTVPAGEHYSDWIFLVLPTP